MTTHRNPPATSQQLPGPQSHQRPRPWRPALFAGLLLALGASASGLRADEGNRFEKQIAPVPAASAGEWWKTSWNEGWTYHHRGDFTLGARVRIREKAKVHWWQSLLSGAEEYIGEMNLEARGKSLAESGVLRNQKGEILLSRYYPRTDVTRAIFRKPVGDPTFVDDVLGMIVDDKTRGNLITTFMGSLFGAASTLVVQDPSLTTAKVAGAAGVWVGSKADDLASEQLKKHGIQKRTDGGIEISPESSLLQFSDSTKTLADLANLAMQFNEAFSRRMFMIRASAKSGDELDARQIYNEGGDLAVYAEKKAAEGADKAFDWLKGRMAGYQEPSDIVKGVLQRETFALSSQIFDSKERKPGDTWVVPADFFNTFLHPDLKGSFHGNVVLHYVGDVKVPSRDDERVVFDAREIEVSYKGKVDGRTFHSTLEYTEPQFSASLREDTEGVLFIDKQNGYVRQANLSMVSNVQAGLPDMPILQGFDVAGDARFELQYTCKGEPVK
jgi:hypothetical protein